MRAQVAAKTCTRASVANGSTKNDIGCHILALASASRLFKALAFPPVSFSFFPTVDPTLSLSSVPKFCVLHIVVTLLHFVSHMLRLFCNLSWRQLKRP